MRINQLIARLETLRAELGDVPVLGVSDTAKTEDNIREIEFAVRINIGTWKKPKLAVFLEAEQ